MFTCAVVTSRWLEEETVSQPAYYYFFTEDMKYQIVIENFYGIMAVNMSMLIFRVVTLSELVGGYERSHLKMEAVCFP